MGDYAKLGAGEVWG